MEHNKYSKIKIPHCPICGKEMYLDDIDYNFDGNQDNYFVCNYDCPTSAFQKVRYGKVVYERLDGLEKDKKYSSKELGL